MHDEQDRGGGAGTELEQNLRSVCIQIDVCRRHTALSPSSVCKLSYKSVVISTHEVN